MDIGKTWIRVAFGVIATLGAGGPSDAMAQGCIASRGSGMASSQGGQMGSDHDLASGFRAEVGYRWLHSDRMFSHDVEQKQREADGSQEINDSHFIDFGLTYQFTPRFSATFTVPYSTHDRSQVVRSKRAPFPILDRFHTQAEGIGDVRLEANAWVLDPKDYKRGNVLVGFGFSAPTGERNAQDNFEETTRSTIFLARHAVDQSIQPGNGGWGIIMDVYAFREIVPRLNAFVSGSYTLTPEEKYTPTASLVGDYSIADSYLCRGGLEFGLWPSRGITLSLAGRVEGVPVNDLAGGSGGFRRPGYAASIEPGINVMYGSWSLSVNTPVALYRNRQQSNKEKAEGSEPVAAGFADYVVTCTLSKRF